MLLIDVPNTKSLAVQLGNIEDVYSKIRIKDLYNKNVKSMDIYDFFYQEEWILVFYIKSEGVLDIKSIKILFKYNKVFFENSKFISYEFRNDDTKEEYNKLFVYLTVNNINNQVTIIQSKKELLSST